MSRDPKDDPRFDPRFVARRFRDQPSTSEIYAAGKLRDARQEAENRRHDRDEDVDLQQAAKDFLATMRANRSKTAEQQLEELEDEARRRRS